VRKDLFYTFLTEFIVLTVGLLVYFFGARFLTSDELGQYMLVRRITTPLMPVILLGTTVALPRYLATFTGDKLRRKLYATSGFVVILIIIVITMVVLNSFQGFFSQLLFGDRVYSSLVFPTSLLIAATILSTFTYSYYRGRMLMPAANTMRFLNQGVFVLLSVLLFYQQGPDTIIRLTAIMMLCTSALFALPIVKDTIDYITKFSIKELKANAREFFIFGLVRVPGFLGMFGLRSGVPILLAHFASMQDIVYYSAGTSIVNFLVGFVAPFGLILLPRFANMVSTGKTDTARDILNRLVSPIFMIALFTALQLIVFTDVIARIWLGYDDPTGLMILRIIILCAPFSIIHGLLRNPIDAAVLKPINTRNVFLALAVCGVCIAISVNVPIWGYGIALSISLCCALIFLGCLSYLSAKKLYGFSLEVNPLVLSVTLISGVVAIAARYLIAHFDFTVINDIATMIIVEAIIILSYLAFIWKVRPKWFNELYNIIKIRRK
jgi:O-antigen/teichoic acid export membrane protein